MALIRQQFARLLLQWGDRWVNAPFGVLSVLAVSLATLAAIASLSWPLGRDQGFFVWIGSVILNGGIPYRDAWDLKGPLTYYVTALGLAIFRHPEFSIRAIDLIVMLLSCWLLRRVTLRLTAGNKWAANCAWALFALIYYGGGFWCTAQPDGWGGGLLLAAVLLLVEKPVALRRNMAIAGGLLGLAAQLKILYAVFLIVPFCFLFDPSWDRARRVESLGWCAAAFGLVNVPFLALLGWHEALSDYFDVFRWISSSYLPPRDALAESPTVITALRYQGLLVPLASAPLAAWLLRKRGARQEALVLTVWVAVTVLVVVAQGRYWPYHWIPAAMAASTAFGVALSARTVTPSSDTGKLGRSGAVLCLCLLGFWWPAQRTIAENSMWPAYVVRLRSSQDYVSRVTGGWFAYRSYQVASNYVKAHSAPSDEVLLFGSDTLINVFSGRQMPTRFAVPQAPTTVGPLQEKYRRIFMNELLDAPPRYIIIDAETKWPFTNQSGLEVLNEFRYLSEFLRDRYQLVTNIDGLEFWRLTE